MKFVVGVLAGIGLSVVLDRIASDYHENVIAAFALIIGLVAAVYVIAKLYTWQMTQGGFKDGNPGGNTPRESDRISDQAPSAKAP